MEDFEYGILCQEKLSVEDPIGVFWLVFHIVRFIFIVLISAQKRDINHVGQKNPFLVN